jgi:PAS domain-containing protein
LNIFKKVGDFLGNSIYGEIESKLEKILEEIEKDKDRAENLERELQRARLEREEYKNLVLAIGNTIPDMMWAKDINGKYIYANDGILKGLFYGTDYRNVIGKNDIELSKICKSLVGDNNHTFGEICGNSDIVVLDTLTKGRFLEWGLINGKEMYLEVYKALLYDSNGVIVGTVGTGRDVTEWYLSIKEAVLNAESCLSKCSKLDKYKFEG